MRLINIATIILLILTILSAQTQVSTQVSVGVRIGQWARYSISAQWISEDPNATTPAFWETLMDTRWETVTIHQISGTNITILLATVFENETQAIDNYWGDIAANRGDDEFELRIISAGLRDGDNVRQSSMTINYTTFKEYAGQNREVNYGGQTIRAEGVTNYEFYWDRETGILCASIVTDTYSQEGYLTQALLQRKIEETNLWQPQPSSPQPWLQWAAPLAVVAVTIIVLLSIELSRRKKPRRRRTSTRR